MKDSTAVSLRTEEIIGAACAVLGKQDAKDYPKEAEFIRQFCFSLPQEDLFSGDASVWAGIALGSFAFVSNRAGDGPHIRVYALEDGKGAVAEILAPDKPF